MTRSTVQRISVILLVFGGFLRGNAVCAQQDSNLQPLAPEAAWLDNQAQNQPVQDASIKASTKQRLLLPTAVLVGAEIADLHSTRLALSNSTGREANRVMGAGAGQQIALKAAAVGVVLWISHCLDRHHPTLAKVVLYGGGAVTGAVAARNYRIAAAR